jgi:cysteine desulfurase/selenocysteine lyase
MISEVELQTSTWAEVPHKFEAGTPPIAGAIGLGAAIDYLNKLGMETVRAHEVDLAGYAIDQLGRVEGVTIHGPTDVDHRGAAVAFSLKGVHPHDIATILDHAGIAVRAGHHCARPLARSLDVTATTRASFYIYNDRSEVDALIQGLGQVKDIFDVD